MKEKQVERIYCATCSNIAKYVSSSKPRLAQRIIVTNSLHHIELCSGHAAECRAYLELLDFQFEVVRLVNK